MGYFRGQAIIGVLVHGGKTVSAVGIDPQFKGNVVRSQSAGIEQAVRDRYAVVGSGVPQECGRRMVCHMAFAGEFLNVFRCNGVVTGQIDDAAHVGVGGVGSDNGIAQDGCLHRMTAGENFPHFAAIEAGGIVGGQMSTGREADDGDPLRVTVPCVCIVMDQLHGGSHFPQLGGEPVGRNGVSQDKGVETFRQEVQSDGLSLPLAAAGITTAGADQNAGPLLILPSHFRHIIRQENLQCRVAVVVSQNREPVL